MALSLMASRAAGTHRVNACQHTGETPSSARPRGSLSLMTTTMMRGEAGSDPHRLGSSLVTQERKTRTRWSVHSEVRYALLIHAVEA